MQCRNKLNCYKQIVSMSANFMRKPEKQIPISTITFFGCSPYNLDLAWDDCELCVDLPCFHFRIKNQEVIYSARWSKTNFERQTLHTRVIQLYFLIPQMYYNILRTYTFSFLIEKEASSYYTHFSHNMENYTLRSPNNS